MMKKYSILVALFAFLLGSCDIIDNPVIKEKSKFRDDLYEVPEFPANTNTKKNVLLEDFTGHNCGNCPGAALVAASIVEEHSDRVVLVALHASLLAYPTLSHPNDFRTPYGDRQWDGMNANTLPNGRVDRAPDDSQALSQQEWVDATNARLTVPSKVKMQMQTEFVEENNHLNIHVESEWIADQENGANIQILIMENGVIAYQLNYAETGNPAYPSPDADEYDHEHMLRTDVNGLQGNVISNPRSGNTNINSWTFNWDSEWVAENSDVVAIIADQVTGEVLNVVKAHVK